MRLAQRIAVETCHAAREARAAPRGGGEEGERQDRQGLALCVAAAESGTRAGRERWSVVARMRRMLAATASSWPPARAHEPVAARCCVPQTAADAQLAAQLIAKLAIELLLRSIQDVTSEDKR